MVKTQTLELMVFSPLFLTPLGVILARCAQNPSLFALHPAANATAFLVCMPASLYVMAERKATEDEVMSEKLVKLHTRLQALTLMLPVVAGAAAVATRKASGELYVGSPHSRAAKATSVVMTITLLGGIASTFVGKQVNWKWKNPIHRIGGTLSFLLGGVSMVSGIYSYCGMAYLGENTQFTLATLIASGYTLLLVKAVRTKPASSPKKLN